jgi:hypothetical protein
MRIRAVALTSLAANVLVAAISVHGEGLWDLVSILAIGATLGTAALGYLAVTSRFQTPATASPGPEVAARVEGHGLDNDAWLRLVEEDVDLIDELDRHRNGLDESGRAVADHVTSRLREVLERANVDVIEEDVGFDRLRHAPIESQLPAAGTPILEVVSPGFAIGPRVLRRAQVRVRL